MEAPQRNPGLVEPRRTMFALPLANRLHQVARSVEARLGRGQLARGRRAAFSGVNIFRFQNDRVVKFWRMTPTTSGS